MVDQIESGEAAVYRAFAALDEDTNDEVARALSSIQDVSRLRRTNKAAKENAVAVDRMRAYRELLLSSPPWSLDINEMDTIQSIDLSGRDMNDEDMLVFASAIASGALPNLVQLRLYSNQIGDNGLIAFADAIKPTVQNPMGALGSLVRLWLEDNHIGDEGMQAFSSAIATGALGNLRLLRLDQNRIGDAGLIAFAEALKSPMGALANLSIIGLGRNQISDAGMIAFAEALKSPMGALGSLVELWLQENRIGDEGVKAFSSAIATGALPNLKILGLSENGIGDAGLIAFAEALKSPRGALAQLRELVLSHNKIGGEGMKAFTSAIASGSLASIRFINLNKATETGKKQMRDVAQARGFHVDLA